MTKTQQQFGKTATLKTWLLSAAAVLASSMIASMAAPQAMAQSTQTTSPDANPGTAWSIRENYFKRYKWAEEFYRSDVVTNGESQGPGTVTPNSGPVYKWPATVDQGQPSQVPTRRDEAIQKYQVTTFGYPVSDTQFQTIQRLNDNMMLEEAFDPERWMWMENAVGAIKATSAANSLANLERNQATSAINLTRMFLDNFTVDPGNVWNRIRNELFIPMAFLLLLPGAVLSQVRAIIAQGNPVLGPVNPFDGILRSIVAVFLIPSTYLVVNYSIDFANSVTYEIQQGYSRIAGGGDMYEDAVSGHNRAFPIRQPDSNKNAIPPAPTTNNNPQGNSDPISTLESISFDVGADSGDPNKADEVSPVLKSTQRALVNGANGALAGTWNVLCAFQMAYLYYLFCIGPVVAALWVWPMGQLRGAFASWVEGVITLCFWSLFWNTTVLLMACFRSSGETGTVVMSALNFLSIASVRHAFDFAGLVKAAGEKVGSEIKKGQSGGGKGGGAHGQDKGADAKGAHGGAADGKGGTTGGDHGSTSGSGTNGGSSTSSATSNSTATSNFLSASSGNGIGAAALGVDHGLPPTAGSHAGALNLPGSDVHAGSVEAAPPPLSNGIALANHIGAGSDKFSGAGSDKPFGAHGLTAEKGAASELGTHSANGQQLFGNDVKHLTQDMPLIGPDSGSHAGPGIGLPPGADSNTFVANNGFGAINGNDGTHAFATDGPHGTHGFGTDGAHGAHGTHGFGQDGTHGAPSAHGIHGANGLGQDLSHGIHAAGLHGAPGANGNDGLLTGAQGADKFGTLPGSTTADSLNHPFFTANGADGNGINGANGSIAHGAGTADAHGALGNDVGKNGTAFDALTGSATPFASNPSNLGSQDAQAGGLVVGNGDNAARSLSNLIEAANGNGAGFTSATGAQVGPEGNVLVNGFNGSNSNNVGPEGVILNGSNGHTANICGPDGNPIANATNANGNGTQFTQDNASFVSNNNGSFTTSEAAFVGGVVAGASLANGGADAVGGHGGQVISGTANNIGSEAVAFVGGMAVGATLSGGNGAEGSVAQSFAPGGQSTYTQDAGQGSYTASIGGGTHTAGGESPSTIGSIVNGMTQEAAAFVGGMAVGSSLFGGHGGEQSVGSNTLSANVGGQPEVGAHVSGQPGQGSTNGDSASFFSNPVQAVENAAAFVGGMAVGAMMSGGESASNAVSSTFGSADVSSSISGSPTQGSTGGDSTSFFSNPVQAVENAAAFVGGMAVGAIMNGGEGISNAVSSTFGSTDASSSISGAPSTQGANSDSTSFFSNPVQAVENAASFVGGMVVGAMMSGGESVSNAVSSTFSSDAPTSSASNAAGSQGDTSFFSNPVQAIENAFSSASNAIGFGDSSSSAPSSSSSSSSSSGDSWYSAPLQAVENAASYVSNAIGFDSSSSASSSSASSSSSSSSGDSWYSAPLQAVENAVSSVGNAVSSFVGDVGSSAAASFTPDVVSSGNGGQGGGYAPDGGSAPAPSYSQDTSSYSGGSSYSAGYSSYDGYTASAQNYSSTPDYNAPLPTPVNDGPQYGGPAPAPAPAQNFDATPSYQPAPQSYDAPQSYAPQSYAPASYSDAPQASYAPSYAQSYDASQQNAFVAHQPQAIEPQPQQPLPVAPQHQGAPEGHVPAPQAPQGHQPQPMSYDPGAVASHYTPASTYSGSEASYAPQGYGQFAQAAEGSHAVRHDYQAGPEVAANHIGGGSQPTVSSNGPATSAGPSGNGGHGAAPSQGSGGGGTTESVIVHSAGQRGAGQQDDHNNNGQPHGNDVHAAWNANNVNGDGHDQQGPLGSLFGAAAALRRGQGGRGTGDKAAANSLLNALGKAATNKPGSQQLPAQGAGNKPAAQANQSLQNQLQARAPQQKKDKEREDELDEELVKIEEYAKNQNWA